MKYKIAVIMITLVMVASTFVVGAVKIKKVNNDEIIKESPSPYPFGEVTKKVWDGQDWVDSIEAEIGDILFFKLSATYLKTNDPNAIICQDVNITDILPDCLQYNGDAVPPETDMSGNTISWIGLFQNPDFLHHGETFTIEYTATVINNTTPHGEDNLLEVDGFEQCSYRLLHGEDTAKIIVNYDPITEIKLDLYKGYNIITIPSATAYTAKDLGNIIEGCTAIMKYNAKSKNWDSYIVGISPDSQNFPIEGGVGYYVYLEEDITVYIPRNPIATVSVNIYQGWNYIGWFHEEPVLASEIGDSIYECTVVSIFDAEIGQYKSFIPGVSPPSADFEIEQGMGMIIYSASPQMSIYTGQV